MYLTVVMQVQDTALACLSIMVAPPMEEPDQLASQSSPNSVHSKENIMVDATSIWGVAIDRPPSFAPNPMPNGDTADGLALSLNPVTKTLSWKQAHINAGPSSLMQNMPLAGRQDNFLWNTTLDSYGMRTDGLAAYPSCGVHNLRGRVIVAGATNVEYNVLVWQGKTLTPSRPNIYVIDPGNLASSATIIGGGAATWTGAANVPFTIPFDAYMLTFYGDSNQTCEIAVSVCPKNYTGTCGAALCQVDPDGITKAGGVRLGHASIFNIERARL
jgi:hypothetical protein